MWLAELRQPYYCCALIPVNVCSTTFSWQERSMIGKPIVFKDGLSMSVWLRATKLQNFTSLDREIGPSHESIW